MTDEDINWYQGIYPSWQENIERSAKAAIEEIHKMAVEAMPNRRREISCRMGIDVDGLGKLFNAAYDEYCKREDVERFSNYQYNTRLNNYDPRRMWGGNWV